METSSCLGQQTNPFFPNLLSQVPLYNRYEALDVEDQSMDAVPDGSSTPVVLPRSEWDCFQITTPFTRKRRQIIVV